MATAPFVLYDLGFCLPLPTSTYRVQTPCYYSLSLLFCETCVYKSVSTVSHGKTFLMEGCAETVLETSL